MTDPHYDIGDTPWWNVVGVDFDNTIAKSHWPQTFDPIDGAMEALEMLKAEGIEILIHTARVSGAWVDLHGPKWSNDRAAREVERYMEKWGLPFDNIWRGVGKPPCPYLVDDRASRLIVTPRGSNWSEIARAIVDEHRRKAARRR